MRILDIFLSGFGIIVLSPLLVIILPVLKLTGEVKLFFQQRVVSGKKIWYYQICHNAQG